MDTVFDYLAYIVQKRPDFSEGKRQLLAFIRNLFPEYDFKTIEELDLIHLESGFHYWIIKVLRNEPHSKNVKSIWFGLFEALYEDYKTVELYLMGSTVTPEEDKYDWACVDEDSYWPDERYAKFDIFRHLYEPLQNIDTYKSQIGDLKVLIFCSLIYLLVINGIEDIKEIVLDGRNELYIGCGFDDMDFYMYGKLTSSGLIDLKEQDY